MSTGVISTVAGTGSTSGGYNGDNIQATAAMLNFPCDVVLDSAGNLYISDLLNHRIRKVTVSTGVITTFLGNGTVSSTGDGGAVTAATINGPIFSHFDRVGIFYISETTGHRIRKVETVPTVGVNVGFTSTPSNSPSNYPSLSPSTVFIITTIAGDGTGSYSGGNNAATAATAAGLYNPVGVSLDSLGTKPHPFIISKGIFSLPQLGNVYFADSGNSRIRKVTVSTGIITTIAGTGTAGYTGDNGQATSAGLNNPYGVALDLTGSF